MAAPSPQHAAALLTELADAEARVRRGASPAHSGFLLVLGLASGGFLLALPISGTERGVLAAAAVFVPAVAGAALALGWGQGSARRGLSRRFGLVMGVWAALFACALAFGLTSMTTSWGFWLPAALAVAVPCLVGAWRELPR